MTDTIDTLDAMANELAVVREQGTQLQVRGNIERKTVLSVSGSEVTATDGTKAARTKGLPIEPGDEIYFENVTGNPRKPGWVTYGPIGDDSDYLEVVDHLDVERALRFDPANYGAVRGSGKTTGEREVNSAAIQTAANAAEAAGGTLVLKGVYEVTTTTLTFRCHVAGTGADLYVNDVGTFPLVRCGSTSIQVQYKTMMLPTVRQQAKVSGSGWAGSDLGVELANLYGCIVHVPYVVGFNAGVRLSGYSAACASNHVTIGRIANCKISLRLVDANDDGGSVVDNRIQGGRITQDSADGSAIGGAYAIRSGPNCAGNTFADIVFPGNQPQYTVEVSHHSNLFLNCRWNGSPPSLRLLTSSAFGNVVMYGYNAAAIDVTLDSGASASSNPIIAFDSTPLVMIDHATGVIAWGGGGSSVDTNLYRSNPNELTTDDRLVVSLGIDVGGAFEHGGSTAGFFGASPTSKPAGLTNPNSGFVVTGDATTDAVVNNMRTRINQLEAALQSLGLLN